jgi:hypothetical protein
MQQGVPEEGEWRMAQLRFKDYLVVVGGILLIALSLSLAHVNPVEPGPGPKPQDVNVVNTPLPVQGTVNVGNFPTSSTVTGSVSIANTPNVNVTNQPTVRDADNPARQPFVFFLCELSQQNCPTAFTIPSTTASGQSVQRFVVEYVSGSCAVDSGKVVADLGVSTSVNGTTAFYRVIPTLESSFPTTGNLFNFAQQLRGYADPGTNAAISSFEEGPGTSEPGQSCNMLVSGYLVTI